MANADPTCFTVVFEDASELPAAQELRSALEKGSDEVKLETLRKIVIATLNGSSQPQLLMPIIQFVLPSRHKQLKKLLHFYWEVCPKYDDDGKLKQEMILVCNAIRNDLQHPNEYIRGATLRFLTKISKDAELLEPLIPTLRSCLEHRHAYVRKNAVFAVYTIYRSFENLIPDAPELMETFLAAESDSTCKRNAFVFLSNMAQARAVQYLLQVYEQILGFDEMLQMAVIDLIRKDCAGETPYRSRYIRLIFELLNAPSHSVKYEAATTLTTLTQNPAAVKAAASALIELIQKESDNNVKLIVLDRVDILQQKHEHVLDGLVLDILGVLSSPDMEVRRKAVNLALKMVSSRNIVDVVTFLKKQLARSVEQEDKNIEFRQLLIQSIHICAIRFSEVAANVVHDLMEFLGDSSNSTAVDVIAFVREVVQKFPDLRKSITEKLLHTFGQIKAGKVFRGALWIVGEYVTEHADILDAVQEIRKVIGEIPILASEQRLLDEADGNEEKKTEEETAAAAGSGSSTKKPRILQDGTYATETAYSSATATAAKLEAVRAAAKPPLRALLLGGDFFTGAALAASLTKLVLRFAEIGEDVTKINTLRAEAMLIMASTIRVGQSKFVSQPIDEDSQERILNCLQTLSELKVKQEQEQDEVAHEVREVFLKDTKAAYAKMVATEEKKAAEKREKENKTNVVQVDDLLGFRQFSKKNAGNGTNDYERDLTRATGAANLRDDFISSLSKVHQLTGFSDSVYAEAYVKVQGFDILLDVLIVNQSSDTLQNLCIEFATLGDLKLVERPTTHTLAPHSFHSVKATIKVASTETGVIFGNIIWESGTNESCVILSDVHIDIMDYIKPAYCNETQFRTMWTEFEWENRVNVTTTITDLRAYLDHIMKSTNMSCLTAEAVLSGECDFLSANMYARSLFGEDALANLSIEKSEGTGVITGHVRIRSKTQGIALSLGDKITLGESRARK